MSKHNGFSVGLTLSVAVGTLVLAEGTPPEPAALSKGRESYEAQCARAIAPITARYVQWLERSKREYGARGDLEAAVAFEQEIKRLAETPEPAPVGTATATEAKPDPRLRFSREDVTESPSWSIVQMDVRSKDELLVQRLVFKVLYLCRMDDVYHVVANDRVRFERNEGDRVNLLVPPGSFMNLNGGSRFPVSAYVEATLNGELVHTWLWNKRGPDDWWGWDDEQGRYRGEQQPAR